MSLCALAIDLGGTELRTALVDASGELLAHTATETRAKEGPQVIIEQIVDSIGQIRAMTPDRQPVGLGVGAPGPLDPIAGISIAPPTLQGWRDVPLAAVLEQRLAIPVKIENDASAAALGEWRFGAGLGVNSMVFVTVSTGIGGGVIADGRLLHGRRGLAAEVGHMTIEESSTEVCFCGVRGCWESLASGSALGRSAARLVEGGNAPLLRKLAGAEPVSSRHVAQAARQGDAAAIALLAQEAHWLGVGIVNLLHLYSPERVILGGGVGAACLDLMQIEIDRTIQNRAMSAYRDVPVMAAKLGRAAGLVGAASLVFSQFEEIARWRL